MNQRHIVDDDSLSIIGYRKNDYDDTPEYSTNFFYNLFLNVSRTSFVMNNIANILAIILMSKALMFYGIAVTALTITCIPFFIYVAMLNRKKWYNGFLSHTTITYLIWGLSLIILPFFTHIPFWYLAFIAGPIATVLTLTILEIKKKNLENKNKKRWLKTLFSPGSLTAYGVGITALFFYFIPMPINKIELTVFLQLVFMLIFNFRKFDNRKKMSHLMLNTPFSIYLTLGITGLVLLPLCLLGILNTMTTFIIIASLYCLYSFITCVIRAYLGKKKMLKIKEDREAEINQLDMMIMEANAVNTPQSSRDQIQVVNQSRRALDGLNLNHERRIVDSLNLNQERRAPNSLSLNQERSSARRLNYYFIFLKVLIPSIMIFTGIKKRDNIQSYIVQNIYPKVPNTLRSPIVFQHIQNTLKSSKTYFAYIFNYWNYLASIGLVCSIITIMTYVNWNPFSFSKARRHNNNQANSSSSTLIYPTENDQTLRNGVETQNNSRIDHRYINYTNSTSIDRLQNRSPSFFCNVKNYSTYLIDKFNRLRMRG